MKKAFSLILALTLVLSLSITAFAADITPTGGGNHDVTANYVAGHDGGTVYGVDISWGSMAFTYTDASKGTWQPDSHTYTGAKDAAWSWADGDNKITVTNHSNDGITVTPSYTKDTGFENASMTFDKTSLTLETADNGENGAAGTATNGTITVTPGGSVPAGTSGKIGQITLSIAGTDGSSAGGETTDEKAVITGVEIKVGGATYQSGDTVTLTPDSGEVTLVVKGTNLQNGSMDANWVEFVPGTKFLVTNEYVTFNEDGTEATNTYLATNFESVTTAFEIQYSNDGKNWVGSGVKILYEKSGGETTDDTAVITGVEVQVGDTTYKSGDTVTLNADSGDVTIIVKGTNLQNGSMDANWVMIAPGTKFLVTNEYVTFNEDGTEAIHTTDPATDFESVTTVFEIQYSNDGKNWVGSGVKILYEA